MFQSAFIVAVVIVAGARSHHKQPYQWTARHGDPNPAGDPLSTAFSGMEIPALYSRGKLFGQACSRSWPSQASNPETSP
ncbi:hypothetical protein V8C43DRAFT_288254 [Trichoderma afarasin]